MKEEEFISMKEAAEILGCTIQNVHYLVRGAYRSQAIRKKLVPPKFHNVRTTYRGRKYLSYEISKEEVINYKNYLSEKKNESL